MDGIVVVVPEQLERFSEKKEIAILPNYPDTIFLESMRTKRDEERVKFVTGIYRCR